MLKLIVRLLGEAAAPFSALARGAGRGLGAVRGWGAGIARWFRGAATRGLVALAASGAVVAAVARLVERAKQIDAESVRLQLDPVAFQELERAAEMLGMSVEELQSMAPEAAAEFEELMAKVRARGGFMDRETVEELNRLTLLLRPAVTLALRVLTGAVRALVWAAERALFLRRAGIVGSESLAGFALLAAGAASRSPVLSEAGRQLVDEASSARIEVPDLLGPGRRTRAAASALLRQIHGRTDGRAIEAQGQAALKAVESYHDALKERGRVLEERL